MPRKRSSGFPSRGSLHGGRGSWTSSRHIFSWENPRAELAVPHPILGMGRLQPALVWLVGFSRPRLMEPRGVSWPTDRRNQSSCVWLEPRRSWSLPEHLLCQASRDGPKPSTGHRRSQSPPPPPAPSSRLAALSFVPPTACGHPSLRLREGGLRWLMQPGWPSQCQRHMWLQSASSALRSPRAQWEVALPGQKRSGPRSLCSSPGSFGAGDTAELPFSGAALKKDLHKEPPAELPPSTFPCCPLLPLCWSQPYLAGHLPPRRAPRAWWQSQPASHSLCLQDTPEVGVVSESSSLMRKS